MSISYSLARQQTIELTEEDDIEDAKEYISEDELKQGVKEYFMNYRCIHCGSSRITGSRIEVRYGRVNFYKQEQSVLGGSRVKHSIYKSAWRIHEIGLKPGIKRGLFSKDTAPGEIYCNAEGCSWKVVAPVYYDS